MAEHNFEVVGQVFRIPWKVIRPMPDQPREYFDQAALWELAHSIKEVGQGTPVQVRPIVPPEGDKMFELIEGQRRWHAVQMVTIEFLLAEVKFPKDADHQFILSVIANFNREPNTTLETAKAIRRIAGMGKSVPEIANIFGKCELWVSQHLKLLKLDPAVLVLLSEQTPEEKRLVLNTALLLSDLPPSHQISLGKAISDLGLSMRAASHLIKKTTYTEKLKVPKRRMGDDLRTFASFFRRTFDHCEILLDMPQGQLDAMLQAGRTFDRSHLVDKIDAIRDQLEQIKGSILSFEQRRKGK